MTTGFIEAMPGRPVSPAAPTSSWSASIRRAARTPQARAATAQRRRPGDPLPARRRRARGGELIARSQRAGDRRLHGPQDRAGLDIRLRRTGAGPRSRDRRSVARLQPRLLGHGVPRPGAPACPRRSRACRLAADRTRRFRLYRRRPRDDRGVRGSDLSALHIRQPTAPTPWAWPTSTCLRCAPMQG